MSTDQPTLETFADAESEVEPEWQPTSGDGRQQANTCEGCGEHVTTDFARVFGDNDDRVHACHNCVDQNEILRGAAGDPDHQVRVGSDDR